MSLVESARWYFLHLIKLMLFLFMFVPMAWSQDETCAVPEEDGTSTATRKSVNKFYITITLP